MVLFELAMTDILLIQLPIPQLNFGARTGNVPLAAACIKQAAVGRIRSGIDILSESASTYLGDAALVDAIVASRPAAIGFTVYNWNIDRSLYLAERLKSIYSPYIVFGGPEATPDNDRTRSRSVDAVVFGPGEAGLTRLVVAGSETRTAAVSGDADLIFKSAPSPYLNGLLEPEIDDMVYLEGQRGCPYRCGFCFYHKSKGKITRVDRHVILDAVQWTIDRGVSELSFLDPSLNARPRLKELLKQLTIMNKDRKLLLSGEIRAESVDSATADLYESAGFAMFEIGLQTITPRALSLMNRPTQLNRFLDGTRLLKERGIVPRIDLIVGLPGDSPEGFRRSLRFVADHGLHDDVQVFPLSVLPGTDFRRQSETLRLVYEPDPPYTVIGTPTFSADDILHAFDEAEDLLDVALFPDPQLNICLRQNGDGKNKFGANQVVRIDGREYIRRLWLQPKLSIPEIAELSRRLTHPYQLIVPATFNDADHLNRMVAATTSANPFTPMEMVFLDPKSLPNTHALLGAVGLKRPHYLDNDLRFYYHQPGNRAVLFTLITRSERRCFAGEMKRQIYWWTRKQLPGKEALDAFDWVDGVIIDAQRPDREIEAWQDDMAPRADRLPLLAFAEGHLHRRWRKLTLTDEIYDGLER